jgi:hypothetical protein
MLRTYQPEWSCRMRQPEAVRSHATSATLMNKTMWDPAARKSLFDRFAALEPTAWGVSGYRHTDHHLRQFGR